MIILITGASRTGKTLLAQKFLEKYHFPYLCIDHLKMGLIRAKFTALTPLDDDELTPWLWSVVKEIIKTAVENNQNLIVEGCYVPPFWRKDFSKEYLKNIKFICLAMSDEFINSHFDEIKKHSLDIEMRLENECDIKDLKADNQKFMREFKKHGEKITLIENNYEKTINWILNLDI